MDKPAQSRLGRPPSTGREDIVNATLDLLRDDGLSAITTRQVAARAGVSEASVYYHYTDKAGLLRAVFAKGLQPLRELNQRDTPSGDRTQTLTSVARAIERFLDQSLPVLMAAQSDAELRSDLATHMAEEDLGPHRGVQAISEFLASEQAAGRVRQGVDCETVAFLLVSAAFLRASQRQLMGEHRPPALPSLKRTIATLDVLLDV